MSEANDIKILYDAVKEVENVFNELDNEKLKKKLTDKLRVKRCDEKIIKAVSEETDLKKMINSLMTAARIQICFLVDVTGSMASHSKATNQFVALVTKAVLECGIPNAQFKYAYLGYRERNENYELRQFTEDSEKIVNAIRDTERTGGDDGCEDVEFAFKTLFDEIEWEFSGTRILFHVCDAPCHGERYSGGFDDDHPDWSDDIPKCLKKLIRVYRVFYWFARITTYTDTMVQEFNTILQDIATPEIQDLCQVNEINLEGVKDVVVNNIKEMLLKTMATAFKTAQYD